MYRTSLQRNLPCSRADMRVICDLFVVHSDEMHWLGIVSRRESPEVCSQKAVARLSVLQGHCTPSVTSLISGFANSANPPDVGSQLKQRETTNSTKEGEEGMLARMTRGGEIANGNGLNRALSPSYSVSRTDCPQTLEHRTGSTARADRVPEYQAWGTTSIQWATWHQVTSPTSPSKIGNPYFRVSPNLGLGIFPPQISAPIMIWGLWRSRHRAVLVLDPWTEYTPVSPPQN